MPKRKTQYQELEISTIRRSPVHFRRELDPSKLAALCDSIDDVGMTTPISVRPKPTGKGYEYISGDRRFQAARKLKMNKIPCIIKDKDDIDAKIESICENLGREDYSAPVMDKALRELVEAKKQQLIRDKRDLPDPERVGPGRRASEDAQAVEEAAKEAGVSRRSVSRAVSLANLIGAAEEAYEKEHISKRQAELLAHMSEEEQEEELQFMLNETQEETEDRLKEAKARKPAPPLPKGDKGKHNVNPALRLFDKIVVLTRELGHHANSLRAELTEETVAALKELEMTDLIECQQALTRLLDDFEIAAAWNPRQR
jgi:ParB-like chromosome segregation protein Spo0J